MIKKLISEKKEAADLLIENIGTLEIEFENAKKQSKEWCDIAMKRHQERLMLKSKATKLHTAYQNYIGLLAKEIGEAAGFLSIHGWKSSNYEEGVKLRAEIEQALSEYKNG